MRAGTRLLGSTTALFARSLARVEGVPLTGVPGKGPLLLISNHINFLEIPILYAHLRPRPVVGWAKVESWKNPLLGWLFDRWGAIPIRRGTADVPALRRGLAALEEGKILVIGPEGTRSRDGRLRRGKSGIVTLALASGAPILPVAHYGGERLRQHLSRARRTPVRIVVGDPFHIDVAGARVTRDLRQKVADEVMCQLAALLPPGYRGEYADLSQASEVHLRFEPPARSNLRHARAGGGSRFPSSS